jgi:hypothetical protein
LAAGLTPQAAARWRFGPEPSIDIRLGMVPLEEDLLAVFVGAPPGELDAAWDEAAPILESVDL